MASGYIDVQSLIRAGVDRVTAYRIEQMSRELDELRKIVAQLQGN